jgi:hypothetical protein
MSFSRTRQGKGGPKELGSELLSRIVHSRPSTEEPMFQRHVSGEEAVSLLDLRSREQLDQAVARGELKTAKTDAQSDTFLLADVVLFKLAQALRGLGVESEKAQRYAEAVLGARLETHQEKILDWVENEAQELFCLIVDSELARIFLRNKEDGKEVEVGAVKPILFPTTKCEINVFRVIRPVVYRASQLLRTR